MGDNIISQEGSPIGIIVEVNVREGMSTSTTTSTPPKTLMMMIDVHEPVPVSNLERYKRWFGILFYTFCVLSGQSTATLLGRLYFEKGGNSKWLEALVQVAGFPLLIPFLFIYRSKEGGGHSDDQKPSRPFNYTIVSAYALLGVLMAVNGMLSTIGLANLPVSTFTVISASQLAFNAIFSYFLNAQKFTPFIINSLVLLITSSALLVLQTDKQPASSSSENYMVGFLFAVGGAATAGLLLSSTQLVYRKYLKAPTFKVVFELIIYQCLVATLVLLTAFFASRDWKSISKEMEEYELGRASYVMTLVGTAASWQVCSIGVTGLIFEVSALFSNVIGALVVPIVPVLALVFFHDKMSGVKVISMFLAVWGFVSYIYQTYNDDLNSKAAEVKSENVISLAERGGGLGDGK